MIAPNPEAGPDAADRQELDRAAATRPFVHLHLHSMFSLLDGGNRLDKLLARVKAQGMDAVAVTDHGNLHGAATFYKAAKAMDIKPILGIEAYVAPDLDGKPSDRTDRTYTGVADGGFHLVLLAETQQGWQNLVKLSSDAFLNGFYYKPRMDKATLADWHEGLIAINGHLGSSIAHHLVKFHQSQDRRHYDNARKEALWHRDLFGPNADGEPRFYLEMQRHEEQLQRDLNPHIIALSEDTGIPLVCDNDAHFLTGDDWDAHDSLCCISTGKLKSDANRLKYPRDLYVKSPQEMWESFGHDQPEALLNTRRIADRCDAHIDFDANHAPMVRPIIDDKLIDLAGQVTRFPCDDTPGSNAWHQAVSNAIQVEPFREDDGSAKLTKKQTQALQKKTDLALRLLTEAGMVWRYGVDGITDEHRARVDRELQILADKSISAYFLIVWEFVNEARNRSIPVNARGSAVGTMVGYCLGLSNACPVEYGLLFERFTDPDRSEYPDIDIDMCQDGRGDLIQYVREKYGHVAQIITFGTLKAKAAIRDVGRVHDLPLPEVDKISKLIGDGLGTTLDQALDQEPDLKQLYDDSPTHREVIDTARRLEGLARHAGVHAAGVIVATRPLDEIVPLYKAPGSEDQVVTQWDGPTCESVGLLKMDFLGLRTLSIIERAKTLIRRDFTPEQIHAAVQAEGNTDPLDLDRLTFNDARVFDLFSRGDTAGVFQFESGGMRNLLMAMKPDRLGDLIAANALFRPGPMELIPNYNNRKHGREAVPEAHAIVQKFTDETYGIMVYQEQVMQIVHELGGIPLRQAYALIKAISKKKHKVIDANRAAFIDGAKAQDVSEAQANELFELILKFAGYGFNKSHSTGYAIVAYQTAYLKTYFPLQYMAALLTYESVSTDKVVEYIDACKRLPLPGGKRGVEVRPPDINLSRTAFTVVYEDHEPHAPETGHIRFGLSAVKGVGERAIAGMLQERDENGPFKGLYDFCERVDLRSINRATIEALIKCGAFDGIHGKDQRAAMCDALEDAVKAGQRAAADRLSGQMSIFGGPADDAPASDQPSPASAAMPLPKTPAWPTNEALTHEKEVLGFYVSAHPLDEHRSALERFSSATLADVRGLPADTNITIGGMLTRVRNTVVRNGRSAGQKMAMLTIEDGTDKLDAVCFADTYATCYPHLEPDRVVFLVGKVDRRREEPNLIVDKVIPVDQAANRLTRELLIVMHQQTDERDAESSPTNPQSGMDQMIRIREVLRQAAMGANGHAAPVSFEVHDAGRISRFRTSARAAIDENLLGSLGTLLAQVPGRSGEAHLLGPPKVDRRKALRDHGPVQSEGDLSFAMHDDGGVSIDRY